MIDTIPSPAAVSAQQSIPSVALARMAMRLAESRAVEKCHGVAGFWTVYKLEPCDRDVLYPGSHPVSTEYFRIIDRLSRGEAP